MRFSPDVGCWAPPLYVLTGVLSTYIGNAVLCARRVLTWFAVVAAAHNCLWRSQPIFGWEKFLRPYFFSCHFFFPSPVIPHVQPLSGEWKRKKEKSYCIIYHCCPTPFHPSCLVVWAFFPSLLSILFYLFYTGAGLLLRSELETFPDDPTRHKGSQFRLKL
jgi:hypothetical protein